MNTPQEKGDILAARIEALLPRCHGFPEMTSSINAALAKYRAPWTLGRTVNGFTLADGQEWHRTDGWTKEMLPAGTRPILGFPTPDLGSVESSLDGVNWYPHSTKEVLTKYVTENPHAFWRTTRPLPSVAKPILTPEQIADGWVEWHGGECPVFSGSKPIVMLRSGKTSGADFLAKDYQWRYYGLQGDIIAYRPDPYAALKKAHAEGEVIQINDFGEWHNIPNPDFTCKVERYRVKPEPVMVPLGPEDVPPGSALRYIESLTRRQGFAWFCVREVPSAGDGVVVNHDWRPSFGFMQEKLEISRDGGKTWTRCEKEGK